MRDGGQRLTDLHLAGVRGAVADTAQETEKHKKQQEDGHHLPRMASSTVTWRMLTMPSILVEVLMTSSMASSIISIMSWPDTSPLASCRAKKSTSLLVKE